MPKEQEMDSGHSGGYRGILHTGTPWFALSIMALMGHGGIGMVCLEIHLSVWRMFLLCLNGEIYKVFCGEISQWVSFIILGQIIPDSTVR